MNQIESLKEEIEKTKGILVESQENYRRNPESYSAQLLLLSTENHLSDLLRRLDGLQIRQGKDKG